MFRISKNQIIFGANHFISRIPFDSSCWIVWDKNNGNSDFADCELAWTSFKSAVRKFKYTWQGMLQEDMKNKEFRIHPTQKPVALYRWIFEKYAEKGMKILDTPSYQNVSVRLETELTKTIIGGQYCDLIFECEEDEKLTKKIHLCGSASNVFHILGFKCELDINSLRYVDEFDIFMMRLDRAFCGITDIMDMYDDDVEVEAEPEPEAYWN